MPRTIGLDRDDTTHFEGEYAEFLTRRPITAVR
jgi:hypothetical protein